MIGPSLIIERNQYDDIDREHKYPLPPAELADLYLVVELIDEYSCRREDGQNSDEFHNVKVGYILDFDPELPTTEISNDWYESQSSENKDRDREDVGVEIERHV